MTPVTRTKDLSLEAVQFVSQWPVMTVSLVDKSWTYRGEGGANLVISLAKDKTVLRFAKSKYKNKNHDVKVLEMAFFANRVMISHLGDHLVRPLSIGKLTDEDFDRVRLETQPFRPAERCKKDMMSHLCIMSADCALLTPSYDVNTIGDTFSIEIKPKQGWHSAKASGCADLCNRCLKQYAKLYKGEIGSISHYCPLDLFSGDMKRMKKAIFDLYHSPHNRFKIFKNGELIYTEHIGQRSSVEQQLAHWLFGSFGSHSGKTDLALHTLSAMLCTALLAAYDGQSYEQDLLLFPVSNDMIELAVDPVGPPVKCDTRSSDVLPAGSVLQKILALQQLTTISDLEAKAICKRLLNAVPDLQRLHQLVLWYPLTDEHRADYARQLQLQGLSAHQVEEMQQLQQFLMAVTCKDVSLLITLKPVLNEADEPQLKLPTLYVAKAKKHFRMMISVIDLDPKPIHRITKWIRAKQEWLRLYSKSLKPQPSTAKL